MKLAEAPPRWATDRLTTGPDGIIGAFYVGEVPEGGGPYHYCPTGPMGNGNAGAVCAIWP